jgi:hypothetical protein
LFSASPMRTHYYYPITKRQSAKNHFTIGNMVSAVHNLQHHTLSCKKSCPACPAKSCPTKVVLQKLSYMSCKSCPTCPAKTCSACPAIGWSVVWNPESPPTYLPIYLPTSHLVPFCWVVAVF